MPDFDSTSPLEEVHCSFGRALDYIIHRNRAKVRTAPPPLSRRQWTSETCEACRSLCRALEGRAVRSIDDPDAFRLVRWSNVLRALEDLEAHPDSNSFARFIAIIERVTRDVRVRVDDLVKAFPATGETEEDPAPHQPAKDPALNEAREAPLSEKIASGRNLMGTKKNALEMDPALRKRFGPLSRAECREVRKGAGFKGQVGRPKGRKNNPGKTAKRSK